MRPRERREGHCWCHFSTTLLGWSGTGFIIPSILLGWIELASTFPAHCWEGREGQREGGRGEGREGREEGGREKDVGVSDHVALESYEVHLHLKRAVSIRVVSLDEVE